MEAFFVLAWLITKFVIAVEIVTTSHPGARARMQYLAVTQTRVFQIVLVTMNPFYPTNNFAKQHSLISICDCLQHSLFRSQLGDSMYSRLQQMWLQLVSTTMEEWTAY